MTGWLTGSRMMVALSAIRRVDGSVDPVAVPAGGTELGVDGFSIASALAGEDHVHLFERVDLGGIDKGSLLSKVRSVLACLRSCEKVGSMCEKSFSACMRSISTDPTIPRIQ